MTDDAAPTPESIRLREAARKLALSGDELALLEALVAFERGDAEAAHCASLAEISSTLGRPLDLRILLPSAPLRRLGIVEPHASRIDARPLRHQPLALSERFLAHVLGADAPDEALGTHLSFERPVVVLTPAQAEQASVLAQAWLEAPSLNALQAVALCGRDVQALRAIAWEAARLANLPIAELRSHPLLDGRSERAELLRALELELALAPIALFIDATALTEVERDAAHDLTQRLSGPRVLAAPETAPLPAHAVRLVAPLTQASDRALLIAALLGPRSTAEPGLAGRLASQFELGAVAIYEACAPLVARAEQAPEHDVARSIWRALRDRARPAVGSLATVLESRVDWDDLILPDAQLELLREAVAQVRHRDIVHRRWGFGAKSARGLSLTALFSGPSGTGKTLAAEVIANDLGLDLLRVDLSAVVSKYIGETEKHINQIFDAAESGGAVLLFDEADALFGPRSKVKDSHDRNANIEVSFLLQRLEAYGGLAILTTNFKENLDQAFLRRIRFHVEFPFPDRVTRARLWRAAFPAQVPLGELDFERLSRLSLTGGHIRNIAINGAFRAAGEGGRVELRHLADSARGELRKSEKPVPELELRALKELFADSAASTHDSPELS